MAHEINQNVRDSMMSIGWTAETWRQVGHTVDPYRDTYAGGHWQINPYISLRPPEVVAASAPRPAGPRESEYLPAPGPVPPNTLASALLTRWISPLTANKSTAQTPLLVIGQSAWDPVAKTVAASAGQCYPVNFPRLSVHELPSDGDALARQRTRQAGH